MFYVNNRNTKTTSVTAMKKKKKKKKIQKWHFKVASTCINYI